MKKIALLMAVLMLVFSFAACGGKGEGTPEATKGNNENGGSSAVAGTEGTAPVEETREPCEHQYEQEVMEEASCIKAGVMQYICTQCEASYTEEIPALGHDGSGASCVEISVCANCDQVIEEAWGHEDGDTDGLCDQCGIDMTKVSTGTEVTQPQETPEATEGEESTEATEETKAAE